MITLRRLMAEHFKGLVAVDLTFPAQGSILVEGHNETGKSTLFEAIYVALYGEPLVGEENRPRLEEVIAHGHDEAMVELTIAVGVQGFTIRRTFTRSRQQLQRAVLTIRRPGTAIETISRIRPVNERILRELGGLDGDSLRNSCFVEQQELGRLESLSRADREQAVHKLLGLERLTSLTQRFRYTRDHERRLLAAERYGDLAAAQAEGARLANDVDTLAERRDTAQVAAYLDELAGVRQQQEVTQRQLAEHRAQEDAARAGLDRCARLRAILSNCEQADNAVVALERAQQALAKTETERAELERLARDEEPAARVRLSQIEEALVAAVRVDEAGAQVAHAAETVRTATARVEELRRAWHAVEQGRLAADSAAARHAQRIEEAQAHHDRARQRIDGIKRRRDRLIAARGPVQAWENACAEEQRLARAVADAREAEQQLRALQGEIEHQVLEMERACNAAQTAQREAAEATVQAQHAAAREALQVWVRLKGVENRITTYETERAALEAEQATADTLRLAQRQRSRTLGTAIGAAIATATLAAVSGLAWSPAFVLAALLLLAGVALGFTFLRSHRAAMQVDEAHAALEAKLRDLKVAYQATIQVTGDPAALTACETKLRDTGIGIPSSLEEAHARLAAEAVGGMADVTTLNEHARAAAARSAAAQIQAEQARAMVERSQRALAEAQQSHPNNTSRRLETELTAQQHHVRDAEEAAHAAIDADLPWPVEIHGVHTALVLCDGDERAARQALAEQDAEAAIALAVAAEEVQTAERVYAEAQRVAAEAHAADPEGGLATAQSAFESARAAEAAARSTLEPLAALLEVVPERAAIEGERGRAEERLQVLLQRLASRQSLAETLAQQEMAVAEVRATAQHAVLTVAAALRPLADQADMEAGPASQELDMNHLVTLLDRVREEAGRLLVSLDETGLRAALDAALHNAGLQTQRLAERDGMEDRLVQAIGEILTAHQCTVADDMTAPGVAAAWPPAAAVASGDLLDLTARLEEGQRQLYAARERINTLCAELDHDGTSLDLDACTRKVQELRDERAICQIATQTIADAQESIARHVLPTTERNMQILLPQLTAGRYRDVRLTAPESEDGQLGEMDYRIRVWDPMAGRYVAKNLFSGGTRDQCSLALRLSFALATLPQELGVAPGFIILDEPLTAFDAERAQALISLLTTGTVAEQFDQVIVISHGHAFDRSAFAYHIVMERGRVRSSTLPGREDGSPASADQSLADDDEQGGRHAEYQSAATE